MTDILPHSKEVSFWSIRSILQQNGNDIAVARKIAASIRSNPVLEHVYMPTLLTGNGPYEHMEHTTNLLVGDEQIERMVLEAVFQNRHVEKLSLSIDVMMAIKELNCSLRKMSGLKDIGVVRPAGFSNADADSIVHFFRSNRNIQRVSFDSGTGSDEVASALFRVLRFRSSLKTIKLDGYGGLTGAGFASIGKALKWHSSLEDLSLNSDTYDLDPATATLLVEGIERTPSLTRLSIGCWEIPQASSEIIFRSLASNTTLRQIELSGLSPGAEEALARFIADNDTAQSLSLSGAEFYDGADEDAVVTGVTVLDIRLIASALCSNQTLKAFHLSCFELESQPLDILNNGDVQNSTLQKLDIACGIDADSSVLLCWLFEKCSALKHVAICGKYGRFTSFQTNGDSIISLCSGLKTVRTLESLSLTLTDIGDDGASVLGEFIADHPTLKMLNILFNCFTVDGYVTIGAALKRNTTLETLDVFSGESPDTSDKAFQAIIKGVKDHPSLRKTVTHCRTLSEAQTAEMELCMARNAGPRPLLRQSLPLGLWSYALERAAKHTYRYGREVVAAPADLVYYLVREKNVELLSNVRRSRKRKRGQW